MNINLSLENKQINPGVINLKQFTTGTDTLVFKMDSFIHETTDLSKMDAYAVCDMSERIDEVKLKTAIVEGKLHITWHVTGYTTDVDGTITYQVVFKDIENEKAILWTSHKAIIFVNSSIPADDYIAAEYPSILQQWEERMNITDTNSQSNLQETIKQVGLAKEEVKKATAQATKAEEQANIATSKASESKQQAERSEKEADRAQQVLDNINELVGYEPVDAIGKEVMQARGEYPLLGDRLDALQALAEGAQLTINRETFTAKANQRRYVLTKGIYTLGANCLTIAVNGITQPNEAIKEIDETTFELVEGFVVEEGDLIDVTYILMSTIKNAETPSGAQKKVDTLKTWTTNQLTYKLDEFKANETFATKQSLNELAEKVEQLRQGLADANVEIGKMVKADDLVSGKVVAAKASHADTSNYGV